MLVYGDASRRDDPRRMLERLAGSLRHAAALPPGIVRHAALVSALVEAGELAQGIADAGFRARGEVDACDPAADAAMRLVLRIARAATGSWASGFRHAGPSPEGCAALLAASPLPEAVEARRAEGFSIYGLYPECYAAAAAMLPRDAPVRVIGLRSVGAPLAAAVASAIGAPPPATLRPIGHPFRREVRTDGRLAATLLAEPRARYAVVDEGPGLSGSSFGAVSDFLEGRGVDPGRIHLLPGHGNGPGPEGSARHRALFARTGRVHAASFDELVLRAPRPEHRLEAWVADLVGPAEAPLEEVSGGGWRRHLYRREADWPPVHAAGERRKFLLRAGGARWLLRFAGLGPDNARKEMRARALAEAGFSPPVAGYRHGFLAERWVDGARPLGRGDEPRRLAEQVGRYLGFRAERFAAPPGSGASPAALLEMARRNAGLSLGPDAARALDRWEPALPRLERAVRRVETDNRLHRWEWVVAPDGRLLKCDALDHHAGHDLVGCQDLAWDLAAATVELSLGPDEARVLRDATGRGAEPELAAFLRPCYLAFQLGQHALAAEAAGGWPAERTRLDAAVGRYRGLLRVELG